MRATPFLLASIVITALLLARACPTGAAISGYDAKIVFEKGAQLSLTLGTNADMTGASALASASPDRQVVTFGDPAGLLASSDWFFPGARGMPSSSGNNYVEHGVKFVDGVTPPDPRLDAVRYGHYHLGFSDTNIVFSGNSTICVEFNPDNTCKRTVTFSVGGGGRCFVDGMIVPPAPPEGIFCPKNATFRQLASPENEPRSLTSHAPRAVIQMTYDPNNDGRPDRFNLISLEVHSGKLNVGVKYADGQIAVYNNLTAGFRWFLIDANNLTRATFERPARFTENFIVDNVAFEATTGAGLPAAALAPTDDVIEGETEHEPLAQVFPDSSIFEPPDVCGALVATIVGTPGPDVINGTSGPDVILGLGGNDKIRGLGGNDTICGNGGADELYGRGGTDFIFGGEGIDLLHGGVGNDRLSGDDGDDAVYGDDGADSLFGNLGDDLLHAGPGDDRLDGGPDTDKCNGGLDTDTASNCEILFFIP